MISLFMNNFHDDDDNFLMMKIMMMMGRVGRPSICEGFDLQLQTKL